MALTPKQILFQQRKLREEHAQVLRKQGPVSYEESLGQVKRSLGPAYRPVPQESLEKLGIIKKVADQDSKEQKS